MPHLVDLTLRLVLLPLLVVQAIWVRSRALTLPEAAGPRQGSAGSGPDMSLLILGDSAAAGVGAAAQSAALAGQLAAALGQSHHLRWCLEAETGRTTSQVLDVVRAMPDGAFDVVVTSLGVNDVTGMVPLELWLARQRRLVKLLQTRFQARLIILSGLPPMGHFPLLPQPLRWVLGRQAARFDRHLGQLARGLPGVIHLPLDFEMTPDQAAADGYHPGPEIYAAWAGALAMCIQANLSAPDAEPRRGGDR